MSDVANSTNQIQFCLFASGGKISAPAIRSLFTFPMNSTLNFPPLTGTHDATRKANLPWAVHLVLFSRPVLIRAENSITRLNLNSVKISWICIISGIERCISTPKFTKCQWENVNIMLLLTELEVHTRKYLFSHSRRMDRTQWGPCALNVRTNISSMDRNLG